MPKPKIKLDNPARRLLHYAAAQGDLKWVQSILKQKPSLLALADVTSGMTALHFAARSGHLKVVEWLFQVDTENVAHLDSKRHNALFYAIQSENFELFEWFLENRELDFNHVDDDGGTPMNEAATMGTFEVFKWFMENAPRDAINDAKKLLLVNCVHSELLEKIQWLIRADLAVVPDNILVHASKMANTNIFTYLADQFPHLLLKRDWFNRLPIHYFAKEGKSDLVFWIKAKALEKLNIKIEDVADIEGNTPFFYAIKNGHFLLAKRLINEADIDLCHRNLKNETSFHCTVSFYYTKRNESIKKIEDLKTQFINEVSSEQEHKEVFLSCIYACMDLSRKITFAKLKEKLDSKFYNPWFKKLWQIKESHRSEVKEAGNFRQYLFNEIKRRPVLGLTEQNHNMLVKQKQEYLQGCTTVFNEIQTFLGKNSAYIALEYFAENMECYLNTKEMQDHFIPKLPVKSDRSPIEKVEEQQTTKPQRENDSELEERQPKRAKSYFFPENAQNSKSEFQDPESGPSL